MTAGLSGPAGRHPAVTPPLANSAWVPLFRIGGIAGLVFVALVVVPLILLFVAPVPPADAAELLRYIADHKGVYLIELVCFLGLSVPTLLVFVGGGPNPARDAGPPA